MVVGATGGVGNSAVQLAKRAGSRVIATAATPGNRQLVSELGADVVVDYTDATGVALALTVDAPEGVDVVLHFAGDPAAAASSAKHGARFVSASAHGDVSDRPDLVVHSVRADISTAKLNALAQLVSDGDLVVCASQTFELQDAAAALRAFGSGKTGKIVITVSE